MPAKRKSGAATEQESKKKAKIRVASKLKPKGSLKSYKFPGKWDENVQPKSDYRDYLYVGNTKKKFMPPVHPSFHGMIPETLAKPPKRGGEFTDRGIKY